MSISVTLPWPRKELSPNFRTRSQRWVNSVKKEYRNAASNAAWDHGIRPQMDLRLERVIFHPPAKYKYDDDNLKARFKHGRDGLAHVMGVDDFEFNDVPHEIGSVVKGGAVVAVLHEIPAD